MSIIEPDIAQQFALKIGLRSEDSAGDHIALELAKPDLHLIEPRGVGGRVMQRNVGMLVEKAFHEFGFVGREIRIEAVSADYPTFSP